MNAKLREIVLESGSSDPSDWDATTRREAWKWTHGQAQRGKHTPTYRVWTNMHARCRNPRHPGARRYHDRGIRVCARWQRFENFLADMGEKPPGLSLDRIDNDGNYEPGNCRWADAKTQVQNSANAKLVTFQGQTRCVAEWARHLNMPIRALHHRLLSGWRVDAALTVPIGRGKNHYVVSKWKS